VPEGTAWRFTTPSFNRIVKRSERTYDFITCTEVVEHFHHPALEFRRLDALLKPGGWLAIQTTFQTDDARFARWNYRRDPTHVVFYRPYTFGMHRPTCHRLAANLPEAATSCLRMQA
jgi:cyclopropane fatty-acyl-phospholipid synthase-like methyltransferase